MTDAELLAVLEATATAFNRAVIQARQGGLHVEVQWDEPDKITPFGGGESLYVGGGLSFDVERRTRVRA